MRIFQWQWIDVVHYDFASSSTFLLYKPKNSNISTFSRLSIEFLETDKFSWIHRKTIRKLTNIWRIMIIQISCDWLEQAEENEKESNREKIMFEVFSHWDLQTFLEKFRFLFVAVYFKVGYTKNHCKQWRGNTNRQIHILVDTIHMHGNGIWEASTMWSDATNYKRSQSLQIYNINVSISFEIEIFGSKPAIELNSFWKYSKYSWENGTYVCGHYASRKYSI